MTDTAPTVRLLAPAEVDVVAALHALCFEETWDRQSLHGLLISPGVFGCFVINATSGIAGGFVLGRIAAKECEILTIGVKPAARQRGWGAQLVHGLISEARRRGAEIVVLEVAADNVAAIALYKGLGFTVVGRRRAYYKRGKNSVDAHIMRLEVGNGRAASPDVHNQSVD